VLFICVCVRARAGAEECLTGKFLWILKLKEKLLQG